MPPALENRPTLPAHLFIYKEAFYDLSCHRTVSEAGPNAISFSDVTLYAQTHGFFDSREIFELFKLLVMSCDAELLTCVSERRAKEFERIRAKNKA